MRARLKDLSFSREGEQILTLSTKEDFRERFDELKDADLTVEIKRYRKKRSLDANGLYWSAITKLAQKLNVSNAYLHNAMLRQYGQPEFFGEKVAYIMLPDTDETEDKVMSAETYHVKPTSQTKDGKDGVTYRAYMLMRGSSTYNSEEFSRLLSGLLESCETAGIHIDTMSQRERSLLADGS